MCGVPVHQKIHICVVDVFGYNSIALNTHVHKFLYECAISITLNTYLVESRGHIILLCLTL